MKLRNVLCLTAVLALSPACGDDGGGGNPDSSLPNADSSLPTADSSLPTPDSSLPTPDAMVPDGMVDAMPLVGLADARAQADGATNVIIENVLVTYTKPAIGNDVAGFFVQKAMTGPALFVAIDPATLSPVPAVGDDVSFNITEMGTAASLRQATAVSGWTVNSSGNAVSGLVQDVSSAADLASAVGDYESELITVAVTATSDFTSAGSMHVAGDVDTAGVTAGDLKLRIPDTLQDIFGLENTCALTITATPLWRFNTTAQVSAWNDTEITGTCPAPQVVSITPTSATEITVEINRYFDAVSITDVGTQFTFDNGLTAIAGSVTGRTITLTTSSQSPGQAYNLTIDSAVLDVLGGSAMSTTAFNGFGTPEGVCDDEMDDDADTYYDCLDSDCSSDAACNYAAQLYLWEVHPDQPSTDTMEFVEIINKTGGSVDLSEYYVIMVNDTDDLSYATYQLAGTLADGAVYVLGNAAVTGADQTLPANGLQNGDDGVLLVHCPTCTDATTDFPTDTDPGTMATFTSADGKTVTKVDGLAYGAGDAGVISKVGVAGAFADSTTAALQRTSLDGWTLITPSPGATGIQP